MFFICGFPSETTEEYALTVEFIKKNSNIIASHGCSRFSLGKYSPIVFEPDKYNIEIIYEDSNNDAKLDFNFNRLNVSKQYYDKIDSLYERAIKNTPTYAHKTLSVIFRENWIILWRHINEKLNKKEPIWGKSSFNDSVFIIHTKRKVFIFNSKVSEIYEFDYSSKYVFDLIEKLGHQDLDKLSSEASSFYGISFNEARESIKSFIELLKTKDLIDDQLIR